MIAALFLRFVNRCRSTQFSATLSAPPTNHLAKGGFQSSTFFHFFRERSSEASRAQNLSGDLMLSACIFLYCAMLASRAFFANSAEGLKTRFSCRTDLKSELMMRRGGRAGGDCGKDRVPSQDRVRVKR